MPQEALSCPCGSYPRRQATALLASGDFNTAGMAYWRNAPRRFPAQRMLLQVCLTPHPFPILSGSTGNAPRDALIVMRCAAITLSPPPSPLSSSLPICPRHAGPRGARAVRGGHARRRDVREWLGGQDHPRVGLAERRDAADTAGASPPRPPEPRYRTPTYHPTFTVAMPSPPCAPSPCTLRTEHTWTRGLSIWERVARASVEYMR